MHAAVDVDVDVAVAVAVRPEYKRASANTQSFRWLRLSSSVCQPRWRST